jgi:cellulose synthase/poly-beta-1,6-N-acetylglucosamine synthase-like glycosyltransferase
MVIVSFSASRSERKKYLGDSIGMNPLEIVFVISTLILAAYLVRHYLFTLKVVHSSRATKSDVANSHERIEPTVAILIPARNEGKVIGRLLQRATQLSYPKEKLQIVVIDDASSDRTGEVADQFAQRFSFVKVIHRVSGGVGKSAAMNAGLENSKGSIVLCIDADYFPQKDLVSRLVIPFEDPCVGAVQGRVVVLNEPLNLVTRLVALERMGGYRIDQQARDELMLIPQFGGTIGGFRRELLERIGGWDESILAEDTDLTFRILLSGYQIRYVGDVESYEEAVDTWRAYGRQRYRWAKGHMQCALKHSWKVLRSHKLSGRQKADGFLLLSVYFMPIVFLMSLILGVSLIVLGSSILASASWLLLPLSLFSFVGNFAPFFEVSVGAYLDGRSRTLWLLPLMFLTFFYNALICTKALFDLLASKVVRKNNPVWVKTTHNGSGNCYIEF